MWLANRGNGRPQIGSDSISAYFYVDPAEFCLLVPSTIGTVKIHQPLRCCLPHLSISGASVHVLLTVGPKLSLLTHHNWGEFNDLDMLIEYVIEGRTLARILFKPVEPIVISIALSRRERLQYCRSDEVRH